MIDLPLSSVLLETTYLTTEELMLMYQEAKSRCLQCFCLSSVCSKLNIFSEVLWKWKQRWDIMCLCFICVRVCIICSTLSSIETDTYTSRPVIPGLADTHEYIMLNGCRPVHYRTFKNRHIKRRRLFTAAAVERLDLDSQLLACTVGYLWDTWANLCASFLLCVRTGVWILLGVVAATVLI